MTAKTNDIELSLRSKVRHVMGEGCERKKNLQKTKPSNILLEDGDMQKKSFFKWLKIIKMKFQLNIT